MIYCAFNISINLLIFYPHQLAHSILPDLDHVNNDSNSEQKTHNTYMLNAHVTSPLIRSEHITTFIANICKLRKCMVKGVIAYIAWCPKIQTCTVWLNMVHTISSPYNTIFPQGTDNKHIVCVLWVVSLVNIANCLAPMRYGCNLKIILFKVILQNNSSGSGCDIQINICAEHQEMLPRARLVCPKPWLKPIGRSPDVPNNPAEAWVACPGIFHIS